MRDLSVNIVHVVQSVDQFGAGEAELLELGVLEDEGLVHLLLEEQQNAGAGLERNLAQQADDVDDRPDDLVGEWVVQVRSVLAQPLQDPVKHMQRLLSVHQVLDWPAQQN